VAKPPFTVISAETLPLTKQVRYIIEVSEITHACPVGDSNETPCCGLSPFELPMTDRMTLVPELVNCSRAALSVLPERKEGNNANS